MDRPSPRSDRHEPAARARVRMRARLRAAPATHTKTAPATAHSTASRILPIPVRARVVDASMPDFGGSGPALVGVERLRPAVDRADRVRLRAWAEGAAVFVEKAAQNSAWTSIPPAPSPRFQDFEEAARRAGLGDARIRELLAATPPLAAGAKHGQAGQFDALGPTERRERELVHRAWARHQHPPALRPLSGRALLDAVDRAVARKRADSAKSARATGHSMRDVALKYQADSAAAARGIRQACLSIE